MHVAGFYVGAIFTVKLEAHKTLVLVRGCVGIAASLGVNTVCPFNDPYNTHTHTSAQTHNPEQSALKSRQSAHANDALSQQPLYICISVKACICVGKYIGYLLGPMPLTV